MAATRVWCGRRRVRQNLNHPLALYLAFAFSARQCGQALDIACEPEALGQARAVGRASSCRASTLGAVQTGTPSRFASSI